MAHKIEELLHIMARLRDPGKGCPWDLKQDWNSIAPYTIEEAYEVADAIEQGDFDELRSELGDLLFQVVFYARLGEEQGRFDFDGIVDAICEKMIRRHPHVFADSEYEDETALKAAWDAEKSRERQDRNQGSSALEGVALALPALVRADKLQKRAARVGFDWPDAGGAMDKLLEELEEVQQAVEEADAEALKDELGDLLFAAVNIARLLGVDAEQALRRGNSNFESRFHRMENLLRAEGHEDPASLSLKQLENAWERAKAMEKMET
ncbi:nucleoside triphosphate pyrophosphohydrolase [Thiolapillus brandeum]|uniref:Nucleoside triphosphate pyrophosphohydrolase n=1 Tax=Thiolapillus brandeum TaxID=1076588 RepID=A0A7U6JIS5_9GAMM|nr:nucleoside triphosphate pyrophosphohydrolase [Thiolapillus brandeum]BAO45172.1 nucleoside triphosphate pyrophosphohydrolase [Thiolapillus brandeum]